jgi:hypothetical protein
VQVPERNPASRMTVIFWLLPVNHEILSAEVLGRACCDLK